VITGNPVGDFILWLLFSLVLLWALWQGFWDYAEWLGLHPGGRADIQFFPDEVGGEIEPGMFAASRGKSGRALRGAAARQTMRAPVALSLFRARIRIPFAERLASTSWQRNPETGKFTRFQFCWVSPVNTLPFRANRKG
jgi:hypothetical protein